MQPYDQLWALSLSPLFHSPHLIIPYVLSVNYDNYTTTFVSGGGDGVYRCRDKEMEGNQHV